MPLQQNPSNLQLKSSLLSGCAVASVTHEGVLVILLALALELLLKDGDCGGRFIENGPDLPRSPWLTTVPKVS